MQPTSSSSTVRTERRVAYRLSRQRANAVYSIVRDNPMVTRRRLTELACEARPDLWTDPAYSPKRVLSWLHARGEVIKHYPEPTDDDPTPPNQFTVVPRSEREARP